MIKLKLFLQLYVLKESASFIRDFRSSLDGEVGFCSINQRQPGKVTFEVGRICFEKKVKQLLN